jgi:hypothetical protein
MTSEQIQVLLEVLQRAPTTLAERLVIGLVVDELLGLVVAGEKQRPHFPSAGAAPDAAPGAGADAAPGAVPDQVFKPIPPAENAGNGVDVS